MNSFLTSNSIVLVCFMSSNSAYYYIQSSSSYLDFKLLFSFYVSLVIEMLVKMLQNPHAQQSTWPNLKPHWKTPNFYSMLLCFRSVDVKSSKIRRVCVFFTIWRDRHSAFHSVKGMCNQRCKLSHPSLANCLDSFTRSPRPPKTSSSGPLTSPKCNKAAAGLQQ